MKAYSTIRQSWTAISISFAIIFLANSVSQANAQSCSGFRTQTQSDWGTLPSTGSCSSYMCENFSKVFPNGLTIGCHNMLKLTSGQAVVDLLPISGTIGVLPAGTTTDPDNRRFTNPFAGQIIALKLNVEFDKADAAFSKTAVLLKDMIVCKGMFNGRTVESVLAEAESLLSGGFALHSLYDLNEIVTRINRNYIDGKVTGSYLTCPAVQDPCVVDIVAPVVNNCPKDINIISPYNCFPVNWDEPTASDNCTALPTLRSNYYSGACMPVGSTTVIYTATDSANNKGICSFKINVAYDPTILAEAFQTQRGTLDVSVKANPRSAAISWVSKMPKEVDYFIVEKLNVNNTYSEIATINGGINESMEYHKAIDEIESDGTYTYRVKAVLIDGTISTSNAQKIDFSSVSAIQVYPNPASENVTIDMKGYEGKNVSISLYNALGQVEKTYTTQAADATPFNIDVTTLNAGTYLVRVVAQGKREMTKQLYIQH